MSLYTADKNNHRLLSSSSLQSLRQEVKQILISDTLLSEEDFYPETESNYIPRKLVLRKLVNFDQTFNKERIAGFISNAHQKDESFSRITQACEFILSDASAQFSGLLILASGSGQLAVHLSSELNESQMAQLSHQMVGVDISHNMTLQGAALLSKNQNGVKSVYRAVTANCTSFDSMACKIPELSQEVPLLTISHGGARYFAQGRIKEFLESVAAFPKGSRVVITEVGAEIHQLMYDLACQADSMPTLDVLTFPTPTLSSSSSCWNLTYYYFLHQHYHHSSGFRSYIDKLVQAHYFAMMDLGERHVNSQFECFNTILLGIAGTRKQAVHLCELHCRGGQELVQLTNNLPIPNQCLP